MSALTRRDAESMSSESGASAPGRQGSSRVAALLSSSSSGASTGTASRTASGASAPVVVNQRTGPSSRTRYWPVE